MKLRTTFLLLLLVAGLSAYVLLHERRQPPRDLAGFLLFDLEGDVLQEGEVSLELNPDEIGEIDVKSATGNLAFRRRDDGTWDIARGLKDRADRQTIKTLLDFVTQARILDTLDRDEVKNGKVKESEIGLDDSNAVEIIYRRPGGDRILELKVGRTAPLGKAMYLRFENIKTRPDIYIVNPDLREFLTQPPDQFRDRSLLKYPLDRIRKFAVRLGEGQIELSREGAGPTGDASWVISRPLPDARTDPRVVNDFLGILAEARIQSFSAAGGAAPAAAQMLGEITLWPDGAYDRKGLTLTFFPDTPPDSGNAICQDRERKVEFKVARSFVDEISTAESPNIFRDRRLGNIDPSRVSTLEVDVAKGDSVSLYKVGELWAMRAKGSDRFEAASGATVEKLIQSLNEADILDFASDSLTDKAVFGLEEPAVTLTFATGKHQGLDRLAALTTDNSRILRFGILPAGKVYANYAGEPFVYEVGPEVAGMIPRQIIRWRSLQLPGYDRIRLRGIRQVLGGAPPVQLSTAAKSFAWSAERAGDDVTAMLDGAAAERIAASVGSLRVASWQSESDPSLEALSLAPLHLEITFEVPDEKNGPPRTEQVQLDFAPMSENAEAPFYYGRHSGLSGVFLIDAATVKELSTPLLK